MPRAFPPPSACFGARPLRRLRRLGASVLAALALLVTVSAGVARADPAPQQWLPTTADLVRALRPCEMAVGAPAPPVCWSVSEDPTAWMAFPAGSPYPWGQCTYYAGLMRPDIWNDRAPPSVDPLADDWVAWTWVEHAQAEGLSVDGDPRPGDVMVYSRAAVGNQTGHVAIVDAVGPASAPATVELTVSEMNVDGLDDAALGQGDTMTVTVPRAQLVPGMIQFIHRPPPGYTAPQWPAGSDAGDAATVASAPAAAGDPSLSVGVGDDRVETVSESTSPVTATVTAVPSGAVVKRMTAPANRIVGLDLPGGSYRVCVAQAANGMWPGVGACAAGGWQDPASDLRVRAGRVRDAAGRATVPVVVAVSGPVPVGRLTAVARVIERRAVSAGRPSIARAVAARPIVLRLRRGRQVIRVALPGWARRPGQAVLRLQIPAQTRSGYRIAGAQVSCVVA